jgi:hypothetical protein
MNVFPAFKFRQAQNNFPCLIWINSSIVRLNDQTLFRQTTLFAAKLIVALVE